MHVSLCVLDVVIGKAAAQTCIALRRRRFFGIESAFGKVVPNYLFLFMAADNAQAMERVLQLFQTHSMHTLSALLMG